jgi:hypothetical protein
MGNVTNYNLIRINNCPIAVDPWYQIFHNFNPLWNVDPPESWIENIEQAAAFQTLIITVAGTQPGEIVTFNQPLEMGLTAISADLNGLAAIPAILAVRSTDEHAVLSRANRAAIGSPTVSVAIFQRVATLNTPGAISHQLSGDAEDATITTTFADGRVQSVLVCGLGVSGTFGAQAGSRLRAASAFARVPSRPSASIAPAPVWPISVPGLVKVLAVPGFEKAPVAVAKLSDGTYLALSRQADGSVRVAGLVPRWPDMPSVSGRWAISSAKGDRIGVFTVRRIVPPTCCCDCHRKSDT